MTTDSNSSHPDKLRDFWDAVILLSEDPSKTELLIPLFSLLDIDFSNFLTLSKPSKWYKIKKFAIAEFLPRNKLKTLITKLNSVQNDSLITKLSLILVQVLTGIEKVLKPFWTESSKDLSQKLWLPTRTESNLSPSNFFSISLKNTTLNSWFSIKTFQTNLQNSLMTSSQLLPPSLLNTMDRQKTKVLRSKKIRLFLNSSQKQIFNQWFGTSRYLYNKTIDYINGDEQKLSKLKLRNKFVTNVSENELWQKDVPQGVREGAVFDAYNAYDSNMKKFKKTRIPFVLGYRRKKAPFQTINLPVDSLKNKEKLELYPKLLGNNSAILIYKSERINISFRNKTVNKRVPKLDENGIPIIENGKVVTIPSGEKTNKGDILSNEIKIMKLRTGRWYLLVPQEKEVISSDNQGAIISLDPGVRTFQTGYSPNGHIIKFGDGDIKIIRNYMLKTDKLQSKITTIKGHKRHRYQKAFRKRLLKVTNRIKDCHRKIVKYLVENYDTIIIPKFHVKEMCKRDKRRIESSTVRNMLGWSHYKFRMMLISKILENKKKKVLFPSEEYTSKTCTRCGEIKRNLGSAKVYKCLKCDLEIDRDVNGSRNILLKTLSELSEVIVGTCRTLGPLLES